MTNIVAQPFPYFPDPSQGRALFNASIHIGTVDLDPVVDANKITVFYVQEDGTRVILQQPLRTNSGGLIVNDQGDAVLVRTNTAYSMRVFNKRGAEIVQYSVSDSGERNTTPIVSDRQTGDGTTTEFNSGSGFQQDVDNFFVAIDGISQRPGTDFTISSTGMVVFDAPPPRGSDIDIKFFATTVAASNAPSRPIQQPRQAADGVNTLFSSPATTTTAPENFIVAIDGILQRPNTDFTIAVNGDISFTTAPPLNGQVDITFLAPLNGAGSLLSLTSPDGSVFNVSVNNNGELTVVRNN